MRSNKIWCSATTAWRCRNKIRVTQWSPKDIDALSVSGQQRSPPHFGVRVDSLSGPFQTIAHNGPGSRAIPQLCLAHVDYGACVPPQRHLKEVVDRARPVRWRHKESVIQERKKVFSWCQTTGHLLESTVLAEGKQQRHHRVSLLTTLTLRDSVNQSVVHRTILRKAARLHSPRANLPAWPDVKLSRTRPRHQQK